MCGRFVSSAPPDQLATAFGAEPPTEVHLTPSWNVAPTNDVWTVLEDGGVRRVEASHWGLVPFWAKDPSVGNKMINARSETVGERNAYKNAYRKRRCIIPADGFYEWKKRPGQRTKQPYFIHGVDGELLAFAGLWEIWRSKDRPGEELRSCTIITGPANSAVADVHDRMPIILPPTAWDPWLDADQHDTDVLGALLVPAPASLITMHAVSTDVNNVRTKGSHLVDPVDPDAADGSGGQASLR